MRKLALLLALFAVACASAPEFAQIERHCGRFGDAPTEWNRLPSPPPHAGAYRRRAEPFLSRDWPRHSQVWFARANGDVKLCVFDVRNPCMGGVWEFRRGEGGIEEISGEERICVF
jgi:hypothetical protein